MDQIKFEQLTPDDVICRYKWDYPIVNLMSGHTRQCCRTPKQELTEEILTEYGTDAISNTKYEKMRRLEKLTGYTHRDCTSCIQLEKNGVVPPRTGKVEFLEYLKKAGQLDPKVDSKNFALSDLAKNINIKSKLLRADHPEMLEIVLGNHCDLKCTYCNAHYSTKWAEELIAHGEMSRREYNLEFPKAPPSLDRVFWQWFEETAVPNVDCINVLGGEPLLMNRFYHVLDRVIEGYDRSKAPGIWRRFFKKPDIQKKRPEFGLISNFNASEINMKKFLSYLPDLSEHFRLHIQPSMEAMGGKAEYIRFGVSWERFTRNVELTLSELSELRNTDKEAAISFQIALNTISISSLPEFLKWVISLYEKFGVPIGLAQNVISFPVHHNPMILTPDFERYFDAAIAVLEKQNFTMDKDLIEMGYLRNSWKYYKWYLLGIKAGLVKPARDYSEDRRKFSDFIRTNDQRRGTNFLATFPEYQEFMSFCSPV